MITCWCAVGVFPSLKRVVAQKSLKNTALADISVGIGYPLVDIAADVGYPLVDIAVDVGYPLVDIAEDVGYARRRPVLNNAAAVDQAVAICKCFQQVE